MPSSPHSLQSGQNLKQVGLGPGYVYLACSSFHGKKRKCIHPRQIRPTRMKKACKACRTHKIKCHPEHHLAKSRMKKVAARQVAAIPKSPEMLCDQIDHKIISSLALSVDLSWPTFTSDEWEQFLANLSTPVPQLPLPHFPIEPELEKEKFWHHLFKGMNEILELNSNTITDLDVNDGFGNEAENARLPILIDFSSGLEVQITHVPASCNNLNTSIDNWEAFFGLETALLPNVSLDSVPYFSPGAENMQNIALNGMNEIMQLDMPNNFGLNIGSSNWHEFFSLSNHPFTPIPNNSDHWSYDFGPPIY